MADKSFNAFKMAQDQFDRVAGMLELDDATAREALRRRGDTGAPGKGVRFVQVFSDWRNEPESAAKACKQYAMSQHADQQ